MGKFEQALDKYAKYVIQQSRSNLTRKGKGRGDLYKSLSYNIEKGKVKFLSAKYGAFVDQGVKGADPNNLSPNAKIRGQQAPNSKFRFGSGNFRGTFDEFVNNMAGWAKSKNIRFRTASGQFKAGDYKSIGYIIAKNIYNRGIRPTMYFTKPFERGLELYGDEIAAGYIEDNLLT